MNSSNSEIEENSLFFPIHNNDFPSYILYLAQMCFYNLRNPINNGFSTIPFRCHPWFYQTWGTCANEYKMAQGVET